MTTQTVELCIYGCGDAQTMLFELSVRNGSIILDPVDSESLYKLCPNGWGIEGLNEELWIVGY